MSEQDRAVLGASAVAYGDVSIGYGGQFDAGAVVAVEAIGAPVDGDGSGVVTGVSEFCGCHGLMGATP